MTPEEFHEAVTERLVPSGDDEEDSEGPAWAAHEAECAAQGAEFLNLGWAVDGDDSGVSIASKTSKGILTTNYYYGSGDIDHTWEER